MSKELFVSYGREPEVIAFVTQLKHDLETQGYTVWLDAEDIPAGCDWHAAIGKGLEDCKALIAVITNKYINSRYCKSELYTANSDQKQIFPVIVETVDFSSTEMAKGVKYVVSGINWTMFRPGYDDYHSSLGKLIAGMKEQGLVPASESTDSLTEQMTQLSVGSNGQPPRPHSPNPGFSPQQSSVPPSPTTPGYGQPHGYSPQYSPARPGYQQSPYGGQFQAPGYGYNPQYPPQSPYNTSPHGYNSLPQQQGGPPHGYNSPPQQQGGPPYGYNSPPQQQGGPPYGFNSPPQQQGGPPYGYNAPPQQGYGYPQYPGQYPAQPYSTPPSAPPLSGGPESTAQEPPPNYGEIYPGGNTTDGPPTTASLPPKPEPPRPNFRVGMKLEADDRRFPYYVCVATVMDRNDTDVMVHFDGWGPEYNYWATRDSIELHPPGWCKKHNYELQAPLNQSWVGWKSYLEETEADPAGDELFTEGQRAGPGSLLFSPGMRVEAKDRLNPTMIGVATIKKVMDGKLLISFDAWESTYDYWCKASSTDIHPPMWCGKNGRSLTPPKGFKGHFKWSVYLQSEDVNPAPAHLFCEEQISSDGRTKSGQSSSASLNGFQVGMKLEAKNRLNNQLMGVATVKDVKDGQLLIEFDGYSSKYDFWCKPSSSDIRPPGWCRNNGKSLKEPNGYIGVFTWEQYLSRLSFTAAPDDLFSEKQREVAQATPTSATPPGAAFKPGMKLEAKDRKNPSLVCVSSVTDVRNGQLLIHFDGWSNNFDYWCEPSTSDIHPIGWCEAVGHALQPPHGHAGAFKWKSYLSSTGSTAAPAQLFTAEQQPRLSSFKAGMKLEAKDLKNPSLICVSTILEVKSNGKLLIHFDGWSSKYDYWCSPTTTDIHPMGWCQATGHSLQPPHGYVSKFLWPTYLAESGALAAPEYLFTKSQRP